MRLLVLGVSLGILLVGNGCGGAGATGGTPKAGNAYATFHIKWPSTRDIPPDTNRMIIHVSGDGMSGTDSYVTDRNQSVAESTITIPVQAGRRRLFSAEAWHTNSPESRFGETLQVPSTDAVLLGLPDRLLASGNDAQAHSIQPGDRRSATITLRGPGTGAGLTDLNLTVNQVLADRFPTVLVLELIRDQSGNPITDLSKANVEVTEDGQRAVVTDVRTVLQADSNMSVALVLDRSGSMLGQPTVDLEAAATDFVNILQANDSAEIINFSDYAQITQSFTTATNLLLLAIQNQAVAGSTALYDAVDTALSSTATQGGRMAVIAMTDGEDNASNQTVSTVIDHAKALSIPVFTVGLGATLDQGLQQLATDTGGLYSPAPTSTDLHSIYATISRQLNGQVQILYNSPQPTQLARLRHVVVTVTLGGFTRMVNSEYTY